MVKSLQKFCVQLFLVGDQKVQSKSSYSVLKITPINAPSTVIYSVGVQHQNNFRLRKASGLKKDQTVPFAVSSGLNQITVSPLHTNLQVANFQRCELAFHQCQA